MVDYDEFLNESIFLVLGNGLTVIIWTTDDAVNIKYYNNQGSEKKKKFPLGTSSYEIAIFLDTHDVKDGQIMVERVIESKNFAPHFIDKLFKNKTEFRNTVNDPRSELETFFER